MPHCGPLECLSVFDCRMVGKFVKMRRRWWRGRTAVCGCAKSAAYITLFVSRLMHDCHLHDLCRRWWRDRTAMCGRATEMACWSGTLLAAACSGSRCKSRTEGWPCLPSTQALVAARLLRLALGSQSIPKVDTASSRGSTKQAMPGIQCTMCSFCARPILSFMSAGVPVWYFPTVFGLLMGLACGNLAML